MRNAFWTILADEDKTPDGDSLKFFMRDILINFLFSVYCMKKSFKITIV